MTTSDRFTVVLGVVLVFGISALIGFRVGSLITKPFSGKTIQPSNENTTFSTPTTPYADADSTVLDRIDLNLDRPPKSPDNHEQSSPPGQEKPRVAIVIDDLGYDLTTIDRFETIGQDLTMALIPNRPQSDHLYERLKDNRELIIHMPMEPQGYPGIDPGKNALLTDMSRREIRRHVRRTLRRYPEAVGLNNHMGSAFTSKPEALRPVLEVLKQENRFYLDSNTTSDSAGPQLARELGLPHGTNHVFLDNTRDRTSIRSQLNKLVKLAQRDGEAIGIGHVQFPETAQVLAEELPNYDEEVTFVNLSDLIRQGSNTANRLDQTSSRNS